MNAAFVFNGLLLLAGVVSIIQSIKEMSRAARLICITLLALSPLGSIMDGIFTLDSAFLHFIGSLLGIGVPVVGFFVTGLFLRRVPRWQRFGNWLLLGSLITLALFLLFFLTFTPTWEGATTGVAGLTERILIIEVLGWYAAMGWLAFRYPQLANLGDEPKRVTQASH
jgi:hypothetical membrane protein